MSVKGEGRVEFGRQLWFLTEQVVEEVGEIKSVFLQ